jgi:hypothetical protein
MMRKAISLLTLAFIATSCGGGGSNTTSEYSQDSRGKLIVSVNFPQETARHISDEADFAKIKLLSTFLSEGNYTTVSLPEKKLTPLNDTVEIEVPSGRIEGEVYLYDNSSDSSYIIGGVNFLTWVGRDENKTLNVFIPSGIWNLSPSLKGIEKLQVFTFPTQKFSDYEVFDNEMYSQMEPTYFGGDFVKAETEQIPAPASGGLITGVVAKTANGTLLRGEFITPLDMKR